MRNLLNFLVKYRAYFVFVFYIVASCVLIVSGSAYRQSIYLTSANAFASTINGVAGEVIRYFNLHSVNTSLEERTSQLETEVLNLREQVKFYRSIVRDSMGRNDIGPNDRYNYILAPVLSNTTHYPRNYITIAKGYEDGIKSEMGVVDHNGVVGIVNVCGPHTARIISLLNDMVVINVKIKDTPYIGNLRWRGNDSKIVYMEEVPRHAHYAPGDTVVTTGNSSSFPSDIPIGTIIGLVRGDDDNYHTLKVRLLSNFNTLSAVRVMTDRLSSEIDTLKNRDLK